MWLLTMIKRRMLFSCWQSVGVVVFLLLFAVATSLDSPESRKPSLGSGDLAGHSKLFLTATSSSSSTRRLDDEGEEVDGDGIPNQYIVQWKEKEQEEDSTMTPSQVMDDFLFSLAQVDPERKVEKNFHSWSSWRPCPVAAPGNTTTDADQPLAPEWRMWHGHHYHGTSRDGSRWAVVRHLRSHHLLQWLQDDRILSLEQDRRVTAAADQSSPPSWGLDRIDQSSRTLNQLYHYEWTGRGVTAYLLDSGLRTTHSDWSGRAQCGLDLLTGPPPARAPRKSSTSHNSSSSIAAACVDESGHGTFAAGLVGGALYGAAKNVNMVSVKILDANNQGTASDLLAGLNYVLAQKTASPSTRMVALVGATLSVTPSITTAVNALISAGVPVIVAAGNNNTDACQFSPGSVPNALTVTASMQSLDRRASFANYGTCVDMFAPGVDLVSAGHTSDTAVATNSGTSFAAAYAAGVAALYLQKQPLLTPLQLNTAMTTDAISRGTLVGLVARKTPNKLLNTARVTRLVPSTAPSISISQRPSRRPSHRPSKSPIKKPSRSPSERPSHIRPSKKPSKYPSHHPSRVKSAHPSKKPSRQPSRSPSRRPSHRPSKHPSHRPSHKPSWSPIRRPSVPPSHLRSAQPSSKPTRTHKPAIEASNFPSTKRHLAPSPQPSPKPSREPCPAAIIKPYGSCFQDNDELRTAAQDYAVDPCPGSTVSQTYGFPIGHWCISKVTDLSFIFHDLIDFEGDLSGWDVSHVVNMSGIFSNATLFNSNLTGWNVSKVSDMISAFLYAESFKSDLSMWKVSNVKDFGGMFGQAKLFTSDLSQWSTSNAVSMGGMFTFASNFVSDLSSWTTTKVTDMSNMFSGTTNFNSDLASWDVGRVTDMSNMFFQAENFNHDLSSWSVGKVSSLQSMFFGAKSFRQNLCAWGSKLSSSADVSFMFQATNCPNRGNPDLSKSTPGPFCFAC